MEFNGREKFLALRQLIDFAEFFSPAETANFAFAPRAQGGQGAG